MAKFSKSEGKIGVLIEEHFDETEFRRFNEFFPKGTSKNSNSTHPVSL